MEKIDSAAKAYSQGSTDYRIPVGSFIQDGMTLVWDDNRWQKELAAFRETGMRYLIFSPSFATTDRESRTLYPSDRKEFRDGYVGVDCIDACLRNCEKAGVKVFIALNQDAEMKKDGHFWTMGTRVSKTKPEVCIDYWRKNTEISNELSDELYSLYKSKYPNAFYGWYWVHEFWNYTLCTYAYEQKDPVGLRDYIAPDPKVYTDILALEALSPVLDHLTEIDPAMPMLFSSFYNPTLCRPESMERLWSDVFSVTRFRPGDIWAPMDGIGGGLMNLDILDEWTAAAKRATEANENLHFWINNELFVTYVDWDTGKITKYAAGEVALIDRMVRQIEITSKYAENNVLFAWNHYYSPCNALPGYHKAYMQYVNSGALEADPPAAIDAGGISVRKCGSNYYLNWDVPYDDTGIAAYNLYRQGELVVHIHPDRRDAFGFRPSIVHHWSVSGAGDYEIEAVDFAGNVSPRTAFAVR